MLAAALATLDCARVRINTLRRGEARSLAPYQFYRALRFPAGLSAEDITGWIRRAKRGLWIARSSQLAKRREVGPTLRRRPAARSGRNPESVLLIYANVQRSNTHRAELNGPRRDSRRGEISRGFELRWNHSAASSSCDVKNDVVYHKWDNTAVCIDSIYPDSNATLTTSD